MYKYWNTDLSILKKKKKKQTKKQKNIVFVILTSPTFPWVQYLIHIVHIFFLRHASWKLHVRELCRGIIGSSNVYTQSMVSAIIIIIKKTKNKKQKNKKTKKKKTKKLSIFFLLKIFIFYNFKNLCILHRRVLVMEGTKYIFPFQQKGNDKRSIFRFWLHKAPATEHIHPFQLNHQDNMSIKSTTHFYIA